MEKQLMNIIYVACAVLVARAVYKAFFAKPKKLDDYFKRAMYYEVYFQNKTVGIKVLKEALEVEKLTKLQVASVKLQLGILYYKIKDYEEAVKYFNDIESYLKKEDYGYSKNLNAIILAYINVGQKEKARKVYQEFLKREDEDFTFSRVRALEKYIN